MAVKRALFCLIVASMFLAHASAQSPEPNIEDAILAAARAGDSAQIEKLILQSYERAGSFDEGAATDLLNRLVIGEDLRAFTTLLDELRETNQGKNWQPTEAALEELISKKRTTTLEALLARRLDPSRLAVAASKADPETSAWLQKRAGEVAKERAGEEALVKAAAAGDLDKIRSLLDAGVNINCVSADDWPPLARAANKGQVEAVHLLLKRGAAVDLPRLPGWDFTPLCLTKSVAIAEILKAAGANVHATLFKRDVSILTYIARWGGADMVEWMLKQGVDPQKIGDNQQTLLFGAGDGRTVQLLLDAGVDPNHVDEFGRTALENAKDASVVEKLTTAMGKTGENKKRPISGMIFGFASAAAIEAMIKSQGGLDPKDAQDALLNAAHIDKDEIARVLLANGAKANEPDFYGPNETYPMRPLALCTVHGGAKVLLEYGANPNETAGFGNLLENALENGHVEVAKLLREAGAQGLSDLAFATGIKDEAKIVELLQSPPSYTDQPAFWHKVMGAAARIGDLRTLKAALASGVPEAPGSEVRGIQAAASEGQWEAVELLLAARPKNESPDTLQGALREAAFNSHPYEQQPRKDEAFEKTVELLLKAGVSPQAEENGKNIVASAVFTRNPGGNPKVVELLVAAGADPNPPILEKVRLNEYVEQICKQNACGVPQVKTIEAVERLAGLKINR